MVDRSQTRIRTNRQARKRARTQKKEKVRERKEKRRADRYTRRKEAMKQTRLRIDEARRKTTEAMKRTQKKVTGRIEGGMKAAKTGLGKIWEASPLVQFQKMGKGGKIVAMAVIGLIVVLVVPKIMGTAVQAKTGGLLGG